MTIACGDSHTSTHGAFGAIAFGIGTSQVRDVLASQTLAIEPLKVRRIDVNGQLRPGVYAKDVILEIIRKLGVQGGVGYAYEYAGDDVRPHDDGRADDGLQHVDRRGARVGYVNPDQMTFDYLRGRPFAPQGDASTRPSKWWRSMASDPGASYDDEVTHRGGGDPADRHVGHQPRPVGLRGRARCPARRSCRRRSAGGRRGAGVHVAARRASRSRARRSTWRSSARARTRGCRICARRRGWSRAGTSRRTSGRWSCPDRSRCGWRRSAKGSTGCSSTPGSTGAAPAARCAWR